MSKQFDNSAPENQRTQSVASGVKEYEADIFWHYEHLVEADQRTVIDFMRSFYSIHGFTPPTAVVRKQLQRQAPKGYWNPLYMRRLFPPSGLGAAILKAGLPRTSCNGCC